MWNLKISESLAFRKFVGNDVLFILVISSIQQSKMGEKNKRDNEMRRKLMEGRKKEEGILCKLKFRNI